MYTQVSKAVFQQKGQSFDNSKRLKVNDARVKVGYGAANILCVLSSCYYFAPSDSPNYWIGCPIESSGGIAKRRLFPVTSSDTDNSVIPV